MNRKSNVNYNHVLFICESLRTTDSKSTTILVKFLRFLKFVCEIQQLVYKRSQKNN